MVGDGFNIGFDSKTVDFNGNITSSKNNLIEPDIETQNPVREIDLQPDDFGSLEPSSESTSNRENWLALAGGGGGSSLEIDDLNAKEVSILLATKEPSEMTYEEKQQAVKFLVDKVNEEVKQDLIDNKHISEFPGSSVLGNIASNINDNSLHGSVKIVPLI